MSKSTLVIVAALNLLPCMQTYAWHSVWPADVHRVISNDAISNYNLDATLFPDLHKYTTQVVDGSNTESHNTAQTATNNDVTRNGGFPKAWWDEGVNNRGG